MGDTGPIFQEDAGAAGPIFFNVVPENESSVGSEGPFFFEITIVHLLSSLLTNPMTDIVPISQIVLSYLVS